MQPACHLVNLNKVARRSRRRSSTTTLHCFICAPFGVEKNEKIAKCILLLYHKS
jgi:hypothetical protein